MSDSYFIGTVSRVHNLWRFAAPRNSKSAGFDDRKVLASKHLQSIADMEEQENANSTLWKNPEVERPQIGMMVSLDHTIYFHSPRDFRADEWMFTEMESPWAGDGRGLVFQKIWSREGRLIASCVQEVSFLFP